ncbi:MAG: sigma 54-interacting transcriptional regulator, partial [Acidobacteriota bacterium]
MADSAPAARLDERRRILRLETLYDLALALHADRSEGALIDELLLRVCAVLDPAAAVAVTRDAWGSARTVSAVGWGASPPDGDALLRAPLWHDLLRDGEPVRRRDGALAGRDYRALLATPLVYRDAYLGFFALLDKETRGQDADGGFTRDDRRFLDSVAALGGVALDNVRRVDDLEAQRARLAEENQALRGRLRDEIDGNRIVAQAPAMVHALGLVERVAPRSVNVLVRGESGTGKELIAKLIHVLSARSGPLIALNCAALPEALLESELFGIEGGVATGVQAR